MVSQEVSLYFHIPFCSKRCPYCHFFVLPDEESLKAALLPALLKEWQLRLPELRGKQIVSIYFGGGTPTKLPPSAYQTLLETIRQTVSLSSDCEITLEANPEDVTPALMREYRSVGINRVSLGVQSLTDTDLFTLERTHDVQKSLQAIHTTYDAGITNISIDLMFELPRQTLTSWKKSLEALAPLPISHLSLYNLTIEPNTIFFKKRSQLLPQLPPEEERLNMLQTAVNSLEALGLARYEISAFARHGKHSKHNTGYWTGRPFLGFGPSAFSYWDGARFSNTTRYHHYLASLDQGRLPVDFEEKLVYPRNLQELLAVQLRLVEGVDLEVFQKKHGPLPDFMQQSLTKLTEKGWLQKEGNRVKLSSSGQLFYDTVASELI